MMLRASRTSRVLQRPRPALPACLLLSCSAVAPDRALHLSAVARPAPFASTTLRTISSLRLAPHALSTPPFSGGHHSSPAFSTAAATTATAARPPGKQAASPSAGGGTSCLDFDDVSESFKVKSTYEILRGLLVFKLCSYPWLVRNSRKILATSEKLFGRTLTHLALRHTFFGHFCAGETGDEVQIVINKLEKSGLGGILDYAAEADLAASAPPGVQPRDRTGIQSARTYDYASEAECDANAEVCRSCIEAAGRKGDGSGFAAIKLTALGKPELLEHLSKILTYTKSLFIAFANDPTHADQVLKESPVRHPAGEAPPSPSATSSSTSSSSSSSTPLSNPNPSISVSKMITFDQFLAGLKAIHVSLPADRAKKLFQRMDRDGSGSIDYLEWVSFLDPKLLGGLAPKFKSQGLPTLSELEMNQVHAMISRLEALAELAAKHRVRLMIDAEQTYFQPAIDHLVLDLQRKYNQKNDVPIIFNTYQCYLKDSLPRLLLDLERSRREGFCFAAKVVRGAYMIQERKRAKEMEYQDPIQENLQATHDNYHKVVETLLTHSPKAQVLVATHNERTVRHVTGLMDSLGLPRSGGGVYFGQLLGMCDHVSFSLGHCGYQVYKYVPYGPIQDVIPYLIRRAEENSDMLGGATKERKLFAKEFKRRLGIGGK